MIGWICRAASNVVGKSLPVLNIGVLPFSQHAKRARTPIVCFGNARLGQEFVRVATNSRLSPYCLGGFRELLDSVQHIDRPRVKCALSAVKICSTVI